MYHWKYKSSEHSFLAPSQNQLRLLGQLPAFSNNIMRKIISTGNFPHTSASRLRHLLFPLICLSCCFGRWREEISDPQLEAPIVCEVCKRPVGVFIVPTCSLHNNNHESNDKTTPGFPQNRLRLCLRVFFYK